MPRPEQDRDLDGALTRRSVIFGACAALAFGGAALPAAAQAAVTRLPDGRLSVRTRAIPALARVGGAARIGDLRGEPVGLARTGASTYVAFSLRCPHQGAPVRRDSTGWVCPAHGSRFEPDGDLELGPATTRLARVPSVVRRANVIIG